MAQDAGAASQGPISLNAGLGDTAGPSRMTRTEVLQGVANRFVFSRLYILLYLGMAGLSLATVVLSLLSDCPTLAWYILEVIINLIVVGEVALRLVAFRMAFFKSHWNTLDLLISILCVITILVVFSNGCAGKGEEIFDTLLLVVRNLLQFGRLALIFRRSGKSVFSRIPAVSLSDARNGAYSFDLDLEGDDEEVQGARSLAQGHSGNSAAHYKPASPTAGRNGKAGSEPSSPQDTRAPQPFSLADEESDDEP